MMHARHVRKGETNLQYGCPVTAFNMDAKFCFIEKPSQKVGKH